MEEKVGAEYEPFKVERYLSGRKKTEGGTRVYKRKVRLERTALHSPRAKEAAERVVAQVLKGKKPNISQASYEAGYTGNTAYTNRVSRTVTYQTTITTFVEKMEDVRELVLQAMKDKDYSRVDADRLSGILKNLNHDIQLLSGGKTENVGMQEDRQVIHTILDDLRSKVSIPLQNDPTGLPELPEATETL